ncbi:hypothetical protein [Micromonospora sp. NPDC050695]|uniref:hypothetical protein n=1 Tax=Micromonospora sp. NPDC050695 TaxID=3154938 RepID=UPI0033C91133
MSLRSLAKSLGHAVTEHEIAVLLIMEGDAFQRFGERVGGLRRLLGDLGPGLLRSGVTAGHSGYEVV